MERFGTCWEDKDYAYLRPLADSPVHDPEEKCFCDTDDKEILSQVLNNYDQETVDFYRWTAAYDKAELASLIERKSGVHMNITCDHLSNLLVLFKLNIVDFVQDVKQLAEY